jgi:hypothetical protein
MKNTYILALFLLLVIFAISLGPIMSNVEHAQYTVAQKSGTIEVRDYTPRIVAETQVSGDRQEAMKQGFRIIADYIFGNNVSSSKVPMTAPVMQEPGGKNSTIAPVIQDKDGSSDLWAISFVMPSSYTMETLPKPKNEAVRLKEIPSKRYAVVRFSGTPTQEKLMSEQSLLDHFINEKNLKSLSLPIYSFFNPPWTLPFLRRNEIMMEVENKILCAPLIFLFSGFVRI